MTWSPSNATLPAPTLQPPAAPAAAPKPISTCSLTCAVTDIASTPPTLTLDGVFCPTPTVTIGFNDGTTDTLPVLASSDNQITANLTGHTQPGTCVVSILCPKSDCLMDVTVGGAGAKGPSGPSGPAGAPGSLDAWSRLGNAGTTDGWSKAALRYTGRRAPCP